MIKARNIIKSYQNGESRFQVLKDISLDIEDNDFVVILGASGSGKSTFLNVISGLERPDSGKVFYDGNYQCFFIMLRFLPQKSFAL